MQTHFRTPTPILYTSPYFSTLPTPQNTSHTSLHTPNTLPHTSPHTPNTSSNTFPYLSPHPNTFPHSFHISPYLTQLTQLPKIPPFPHHSYSPKFSILPPFFPISAIMSISPISHLRTANALLFRYKAACKQLVAAN